MPADKLADKIISELKNELGADSSNYDESTPNKANTAISKAITDYLKENTKITISYAGILPVGTPDPIVSDIFSITGDCSSSSGPNFDAWLMQLSLNIQTGFQLQTKGELGILCGSPVLCFMGATPFLSNQILLGLKGLHESNKDNPQKPVWTAISNSILVWLNSMVVPTPFPCTNPSSSSVGTGIITKITVI